MLLNKITWFVTTLFIPFLGLVFYAIDLKSQPLQKSAEHVENSAVVRGRYVATAGDCIACHTVAGGRPFVGGRPFTTPLGTIYSTNITPDKSTGIGNYSLEDFTAAMRRGRSPHGNLYPAMPYTSYFNISDEDISALYQYFLQLPAVQYTPPKNSLIFPANLRVGISFWNWMYFDPQASAQVDSNRSAEWQRGNYLVNTLGHCGECHTPRNFAQAMDLKRQLAGNVLEGWDAEDIRPHTLQQQGWSREQLLQLFKTGSSERGTVLGEMFLVVKHSLSNLSDDDLNAMISYLLDDLEAVPIPAQNPDQIQSAGEKYPAARENFIAYCSGCHGREGKGILLSFAPPMNTNADVLVQHPYNAVAAILRGVPKLRMSRISARAGMPGSAAELSDRDIAELVNFMRAAWGAPQASSNNSGSTGFDELTEQSVKEIRKQLDKHGYLKTRQSKAKH